MGLLTFEQWMKNIHGNSGWEYLMEDSDPNSWESYTRWYSEYVQKKLNKLKLK